MQVKLPFTRADAYKLLYVSRAKSMGDKGIWKIP